MFRSMSQNYLASLCNPQKSSLFLHYVRDSVRQIHTKNS